jgi:predicted PolB exonuclease-like 3'-5' exonuclease
MRELFFLDIETAGQYPNFKSFEENDERGSTLFKKKFKKMEWDKKYESEDQAYLDNAGIISTYGRICCISFGYIENSGGYKISSYYGDNEEHIVKSFNELLKKIELKNFNLCGFRVNYFDIPWILHKLHKYSIKPANIIYTYDKKPWDMRITDLSDDWRGRFAWAFSFDEVTYQLDIESPKDGMDGSEVHKAYWDNRIEDIKTYCEKDVRACIETAKKLYF